MFNADAGTWAAASSAGKVIQSASFPAALLANGLVLTADGGALSTYGHQFLRAHVRIYCFCTQSVDHQKAQEASSGAHACNGHGKLQIVLMRLLMFCSQEMHSITISSRVNGQTQQS